MNEVITHETKVEEVLKRWPRTILVFTRRGMGCVGCTMAAYETLGGAADIYHLPFQAFLEELREAIEQPSDKSRQEGEQSRLGGPEKAS